MTLGCIYKTCATPNIQNKSEEQAEKVTEKMFCIAFESFQIY